MLKNSLAKTFISLLCCVMMVFTAIPVFANTSDATLSALYFTDLIVDLTKVDASGTPIAENALGFNADHTNYMAHFPYNKATNSYYVPELVTVPADPDATVNVNIPADISSNAITVVVTASNGTTTMTYQITPELTGENLFVESDFENPSLENVGSGDGSSLVRNNMNVWKATGYSKVFKTEDSASGNWAMKVERTGNGASWEGYVKTDSATSGNYSLATNKKYYVTVQAKLESTSANNTTSGTHQLLLTNTEGWGANATATITAYNKDFESLGGAVDPVILNKTDWHTFTSILLPTTAHPVDGKGWRTDVRIFGPDTSPIAVDNYFLGELAVGKVNVTDTDGASIKVIEAANATATTVQLSAEALNQYGNKAGLEAMTVSSYSVVENDAGITVSDSGLVTIPANAPAGLYYVEAKMDSSSAVTTGQGMVKGVYTINISNGSLASIDVSAPAVIDFETADLSYDVHIPAKHIEGVDTYTMPVVTATPVDSTHTVSIQYPEKVESGAQIIVSVKDANGKLVDVYTLNLKPVGGNLFVDGGFETSTSLNNWTQTSGTSVSFTTTSDESLYGEKALKIAGGGGSSLGWKGNVITGNGVPTASSDSLVANKTYLMSTSAKIENGVTPTNGTRTGYFDWVKFWGQQNAGTMAAYGEDGIGIGVTNPTTWLVPNDWFTYYCTIKPTAAWTTMATLSNASSNAETIIVDDYFIGELVISEIGITDAEGNVLETMVRPENGTIQLKADAVNQYGNGAGLENETVVWSLADAPTGASIDNGLLTIPANYAGDITVEAMITPSFPDPAQPKVKGTATIKIAADGISYYKGNTSLDSIAGVTGEVIVKAMYTNNTVEDIPTQLIVALYEKDSNNRINLVNISPIKTGTAVVGEIFEDSQTINVPNDGKVYLVKGFLWQSVSLKPILDSIALQ